MLTMSSYIQIPNRINQIQKRDKMNIIYCYTLIRSQIKDSSYKASITEKELAA